jgi:ketosteroid isomerase-like protein
MSTQDNKRRVRAFYEAGNRGDVDTCIGMFADDIHWTNIGSTPLSGTYAGKQAVMERLIGPLFGQLKSGISSEIELLVAEGDHVVALTRGTAETLSGQAYNNTYCHIMRLRDGQIVEVREYFDTALTAAVFGGGQD